MEFIEVSVIMLNKDKKTVVEREAVRIDDIKSFRPWHKGEKDKDIEGEITLLILKNDVNEHQQDEKEAGEAERHKPGKKTRQVLISESHDSFMQRMRTKVIVIEK